MHLREPKSRLIFPLDVPEGNAALELVHSLRDEVGLFKVGLELYLAAGPELLQILANKAGLERIFLDLKLYDIPSTVIGAAHTLLPGLALITVPSDLGPTGLKRIVAGTAHRVLAVTILTSTKAADLEALGYKSKYTENLTQLVVERAKMAQVAGCRGVVCSGQEAAAVKKACGPDFQVVCPGIRLEGAPVSGNDQSRTVTPYEAMLNGADFIVVGRPIRQAGNAAQQVAAARRVVEEIEQGLQDRGR